MANAVLPVEHGEVVTVDDDVPGADVVVLEHGRYLAQRVDQVGAQAPRRQHLLDQPSTLLAERVRRGEARPADLRQPPADSADGAFGAGGAQIREEWSAVSRGFERPA